MKSFISVHNFNIDTLESASRPVDACEWMVLKFIFNKFTSFVFSNNMLFVSGMHEVIPSIECNSSTDDPISVGVDLLKRSSVMSLLKHSHCFFKSVY